MSPAEALAAHLANRPVSPGAVGANDPRYVTYHAALSQWTVTLDRLECMVRVQTVPNGGVFQSHGEFPNHPKPRNPAPPKAKQICRDCPAEAQAKKSRCIQCETAWGESERVRKNAAHARRTALIREGLNQRKAVA